MDGAVVIDDLKAETGDTECKVPYSPSTIPVSDALKLPVKRFAVMCMKLCISK